MEFFTVGNLLTIGIVLLLLLLYRQMDRSYRNKKGLKEFSEKIKKELKVFVDEQEAAVRDYGISLNVERDSARELMKRLQVTEEELAQKAAAVAHIDSQIKSYENSLAELERMTGRVQENMNRIRDESVFVESTGLRLGEAKEKLAELEKGLGSLESRFERDNADSLEKAAEAMLSDVRSSVSDLSAQAETIERRVEEHRQAVAEAEQTRAMNIAKDAEYINRVLKTAVEQAGSKADRMEETALVSLREQAEDRLRKLKVAEEEKLRSYQESARTRVAEVQEFIKKFREDWHTERSGWESRDKAIRDERKKDIHELNVQISDTEKNMDAARDTLQKQMDDLSVRAGEMIGSQEALLLRSAEEMKQKALEITGAKLEEYRIAQNAEFRRLEALTDDSRKLDAELRRNMQEVVDRAGGDFARYRQESAAAQKAETDKFAAAAKVLRDEMAELERELEALKATAYENVSGKLNAFEDDFLADLSRRSIDINHQLVEWQEKLEAQLSGMGEEAGNARQALERSLTDEMRATLSGQGARLVAELERLKAETSAFEEGIRGQMSIADDSVVSLREQLSGGLEEARKEAELFIRAEIGKHSLAAGESIKLYQRDLELKFRDISELFQSRSGEITAFLDALRAELDESRDGLTVKIRDLDNSIEDARRRVRDLSAETDTRISSVRSSVEDAERHIRNAVDETKLIDRAEELRLEMQRRIEDLKSDMDRLDQRRAEVSQIENDFVSIKRLGDDVNAKMVRFVSEKRRIETMEGDFNRLLQISRAVEDKLAQVTASDDTLQGIQLQIRKLDEALGGAEEKFQRMERKSEILDNTNDGIDRNFRTLQESEKLSAKMKSDLERYAEDIGFIKTSIEKLAGESEKARDAADKIEVLDNLLEEIEERINSMQRARKWIADSETRMEELNKQAQIQARAIDSLVKGKTSGPAVDLGRGTQLSQQQQREAVISLLKQGWSEEEIAKAMKISRGVVQLIRETVSLD